MPKWAQSAWDQVNSESIKLSFESVYAKCFTPAFQASALAKPNEIYPQPQDQQAQVAVQLIPDDHVEYAFFVSLPMLTLSDPSDSEDDAGNIGEEVEEEDREESSRILFRFNTTSPFLRLEAEICNIVLDADVPEFDDSYYPSENDRVAVKLTFKQALVNGVAYFWRGVVVRETRTKGKFQVKFDDKEEYLLHFEAENWRKLSEDSDVRIVVQW